jgi:DNA-binding LacI/PurR family transcriptional regulator
MDAVRECGFRIPDDISIIGFDDVPQASFVYPKLTTVRQPLEQMGQVAVKMLLERIEDQSHPLQRVALATQLIIRDSCGSNQTSSDEREKNGRKDRRQPTANTATSVSARSD